MRLVTFQDTYLVIPKLVEKILYGHYLKAIEGRKIFSQTKEGSLHLAIVGNVPGVSSRLMIVAQHIKNKRGSRTSLLPGKWRGDQTVWKQSGIRVDHCDVKVQAK